MPFTLRYDDPDVIRLALMGILTRDDLRGMIAAVEVIERDAVRAPHRLVDATGLTAGDATFQDFLDVTSRRREVAFRNPFRCAVVAREPVHFGFARMFQTLSDHPQIAVRIFEDEGAALAWIRSSADDLPDAPGNA